MFNRIIFVVTVILALLSATPVYSQDLKIKVSVAHVGDDPVGNQFVYAIREAVRGSKAFSLALPDESAIQVRVLTVDPSDSSSGSSYWTVATVVYTMTNFNQYKKDNPQTWYPIYLTSQVLTVGQKRTDDQAKSVTATIDAAIEKFRRDGRE